MSYLGVSVQCMNSMPLSGVNVFRFLTSYLEVEKMELQVKFLLPTAILLFHFTQHFLRCRQDVAC